MDADQEPDIEDLLSEGIEAIKGGKLQKARELLMQVVEADQENERGWLWLSGAVETDEDRRVCLENVLTLNPNNLAAQKGLEKLGAVDAMQEDDKFLMRREVAPISLAAAILHPEQQVKEWRWSDPVKLKRVPVEEAHASTSSFDDIWNSNRDMCAYCAHEVSEDARHCPHCERDLIAIRLRHDKPRADLYILGMLVLSLSLQSGAQTTLDVSVREANVAMPLIIFGGLLTLLLLVLAAGVYARQRWAYHGALIVLPIVLLLALFRATNPYETENTILVLITTFLPAAQIGTAFLGLGLALLRANHNFEVVEIRHVLQLGQDLKRTTDHYHTGKSYADEDMWAMAVPYFQRAAANDPGRIFYQRILGEAYARLGFYERSLDALQTARRSSVDPNMQTELEQLITKVQRSKKQTESP